MREPEAAERTTLSTAGMDPLTGLLNRAAFLQRAAAESDRSKRGGKHIAAISFDLHGFRDLNDAHGHEAADAVLAATADRLRASLRSYDVIGRIGGDDFAVLAVDVKPEYLHGIVDRMIRDVCRPVAFGGKDIDVQCSAGVAMDDDFCPGSELVRRADAALGRARAEGPGSVVHYDARMHERLRARRELAEDLRKAVAAGAIDVAYQLQFDPTGQHPLGVEALARWNRPGHGPVSPSEFIPLAEETGLIAALGEHVLRRACSDGARWEGITVSVNVSPTQFKDPAFADLVSFILCETGLEPGRLEIEITEEVLADPEILSARLRELRATGVGVALDDFGKGHSNLALLAEIPVDRIKLDRQFVGNARNWPIVQGVLVMAKGMGLEITAEGVETEAQRAKLAEAGVDMLQGFLLARPTASSEIDDIVSPAASPAP